MKDKTLFLEVDCAQSCKHGQHICGDAFMSTRFAAENRVISVLSDGLGSGVKANILSSMTATMALKFTAANRDIVKAGDVIMDALPVCQVRKISYSTFTIIDSALHGNTRAVEQGNPELLLIRGKKAVKLERKTLTTEHWKERTLGVVEFQNRPGDRLVVFSDGVTQAGLGSANLKLGWRQEGCLEFVLKKIEQKPDISARQLAREIVEEATRKEPEGVPKDDISCAVLYFRYPRQLLVLSGPPFDKNRDNDIAYRIDSFPGRTAICGGTTANIVARVLRKKIDTNLKGPFGPLPPVSTMKGVDLVTEGILTLTRTARLLKEGFEDVPNDAAGNLIEMLLDSDHIEFLVGTRINDAHQDPTLPVDLEIRRNIIKRIADVLIERYLKDVNIQYI